MIPPLSRAPQALSPWLRVIPGVSVCALVASLAMVLADYSPGIPAVVIALIAGAFLSRGLVPPPLAAGADFTVRTILRIGIALIGVRLSISQISDLGLSVILLAAGGVLLMLSVGTLIAMVFGLPRRRSLLSAGAVGICGASAALAISTVLPRHDAEERQTVTTVALVTVLSTIAMLAYPVVGRLLGLTQLETGVFFGASIHDVTQVAGAGAIVSPAAETAAVATKLVRVACLAPVVSLIAFAMARRAAQAAGADRAPMVPFFLVGFALMVAAANLDLLSASIRDLLSGAASFCLVAATVALGMKTSLRQIFAEGWRPAAAMTAQTLLLAAYVIGSILLFGL